MAGVEELDRLAAMLRRLRPLAEQQAGELIRAEDWNLLVGAVMETARAMVESEARVVPAHDHPDQVQVGWLDPRLRQLVESGPLGDPAELARLAALERADERAKKALDSLHAELEKLRTRLRDVSTRDLERESSVNVVRRKVEGIADGRDDVLAVRAGLDSMRERVGRAVELAELLEQGGQAVDVGDLAERVDSLEELRENLLLPSGERFDAGSLERRLTELTNTLVTEAELDDALKERRAVLDPADRASIGDELITRVEADLAIRDAKLQADLATRTDERLANIDALVARAIAETAPALTDAVVARFGNELDARLAAVREQAATDARSELDTRGSELEGRLGGRLDELTRGLDEQVRGEVDRVLERALPGAVQRQIGDMGTRVADLTERAQRAEAAAGGLSARIDSLQGGLRDGLAGVRTEVASTLDRRIAETEQRVDEKLAQIEPRIDERVGGLLTERDAALRTQFTRIARDEVAGLEDRLPVIIRRGANLPSEPPILPLPPEDPQ
jgi:hypothetical protein